MCRFVSYLGKPILVDDVLFKTKNSLIKQSIHAKESEVILNGDGFGLGWYNHDIDLEPGLFKSIQPAWNDENLKHLAAKIRTNCFFGHIRSANIGGITQQNCHPFKFQNFISMHNGTIGGFQQIRRELCNELSPEMYNWIQGDTDSEHFFALYWDTLKRNKLPRNAYSLTDCMDQTLERLKKIQNKYKVKEPNAICAVLTNGSLLLAMRYKSDGTTPNTMHYAQGRQYEPHGKGFIMEPTDKGELPSAILIVSEILDNHKASWEQVKPNHYITINASLEVSEHPIKKP